MDYYLFFDEELLDENFPFAVAPRVGDKIKIDPNMELTNRKVLPDPDYEWFEVEDVVTCYDNHFNEKYGYVDGTDVCMEVYIKYTEIAHCPNYTP